MMIIFTIIFFIVGIVLGVIGCRLYLSKRLQQVADYNAQIEQHNDALCVAKNNLERELKILNIQISDQRSEEMSLRSKVTGLRAENEQLRENIALSQIELTKINTEKATLECNVEDIKTQSKLSAEAIYEANLETMKNALDKSAEQLSLEYQESEEQYKQEYLETLQELAEAFSLELTEKKELITFATARLNELQAKVNSAVEANKRALEIQQQADFYRIVLSEEDIKEINMLRELTSYLRNPEPLNKVIWKVYYQNSATDMIGRILGKENKIGVYKITNLKTQECYIGQSNCIQQRWIQHIKKALGADSPGRNKLYPAMAQYGVHNFSFELIEECDISVLDEREDFWQDYYHAIDFGYSIK